MSEPVSNVEIEDVLASIRRLVSDEERPVAAPKEAERLVLTPALRVNERTSARAGTGQDPSHLQQVTAAEPAADLPAADHPSADSSAASSVTAAPDRDPAQAPMQLGAEFAVPGDTAPEGTGEDAAETATEATAAQTAEAAMEARIAELEAAVAVTDEQWEPDGNDEDAFGTAAMDWVDHTPHEMVEDPEEAVPEHAATLSADAAEMVADVVEEEVEAAVETVVEAALEDAAEDTADPDQDWQGELEDVLAETLVEVPPLAPEMPAAERDSTGEAEVYDPEALDPDALDPTEAERDDGFDLSEAMLDEEMLRELVTDIVRQELQGSLGERITRNVRKLVRREIHRALTARDLQ